jgi:hypothetical protein
MGEMGEMEESMYTQGVGQGLSGNTDFDVRHSGSVKGVGLWW